MDLILNLQLVEYLNDYVVGQERAKKILAVACVNQNMDIRSYFYLHVECTITTTESEPISASQTNSPPGQSLLQVLWLNPLIQMILLQNFQYPLLTTFNFFLIL